VRTSCRADAGITELRSWKAQVETLTELWFRHLKSRYSWRKTDFKDIHCNDGELDETD